MFSSKRIFWILFENSDFPIPPSRIQDFILKKLFAKHIVLPIIYHMPPLWHMYLFWRLCFSVLMQDMFFCLQFFCAGSAEKKTGFCSSSKQQNTQPKKNIFEISCFNFDYFWWNMLWCLPNNLTSWKCVYNSISKEITFSKDSGIYLSPWNHHIWLSPQRIHKVEYVFPAYNCWELDQLFISQ